MKEEVRVIHIAMSWGGGEGDTYSCVMREEVRVIHIAVS